MLNIYKDEEITVDKVLDKLTKSKRAGHYLIHLSNMEKIIFRNTYLIMTL